jgi:hypothetical protein
MKVALLQDDMGKWRRKVSEITKWALREKQEKHDSTIC